MLGYILKRLLHLIPVMLLITIIIFFVLESMPGDPVQAYLGIGSKTTPEQQQQIKAKLGLDQPKVVRYFMWLKRTLTGDFGTSYKYKKPVKDIIGEFIWNSFYLNIAAVLLSFAIAIPVGIKSAVKKYGAYDNFWTVFSMIGYSMPSFFFALLLVFYIAIPVPWFPINGMRSVIYLAKGYDNTFQEIFDVFRHMVLPAIVLVVISVAGFIRYVRNSVIEVINQDYIRTARAKGLSEKVVIYRHAFRNALLPLVTLIGLEIPALFAGALILETVFLWPGIGNVLLGSIFDRDYSMVMAALTFYALLTVLGNLLADVAYALVDPRVRVNK
jgi:peptide/nickel transport system permease protein